MKKEISSNIKRIKHQLWFYLGSHRYGLKFIDLFTKTIRKKNIVINSTTDIVVEGYPRSANTYVVAVIIASNGPNINIARHTHGSAQLRVAVEKNIPSILLIRDPLEAVTSLLMMYPYLQPSTLLKNYILYYKSLKKYINQLTVVDFKTAVNSIDHVIMYINEKYGRNFNVPDLDKIREEVNNLIDEMDMNYRGDKSIDIMTVGKPNHERKRIAQQKKEILKKNHQHSLRECYQLYDLFIENRTKIIEQ